MQHARLNLPSSNYVSFQAGECAKACAARRAYIDPRNTFGPFDDGSPSQTMRFVPSFALAHNACLYLIGYFLFFWGAYRHRAREETLEIYTLCIYGNTFLPVLPGIDRFQLWCIGPGGAHPMDRCPFHWVSSAHAQRMAAQRASMGLHGTRMSPQWNFTTNWMPNPLGHLCRRS